MPRASSAWPANITRTDADAEEVVQGRVPDHCPQDRPFRRPRRPQHLDLPAWTTNAALNLNSGSVPRGLESGRHWSSRR